MLQALFHRELTTGKDGKSSKQYWVVWREFRKNFSGMLMLTHIQDDVNKTSTGTAMEAGKP
jgi:hypothetical protein